MKVISIRLFRVIVVSAAAVLVGCASRPTGLAIAKEEAAIAAAREAAAAERMDRESKAAEAFLKRVPSWASDPPRADGEAIFALGFGESKRLDLAQHKAVITAEFDLAKQYKQALSGSEQMYQRDGAGSAAPQERFTRLIERLVDRVELAGHEVIRRETIVRDGSYHHFVLMKLSWQDMSRILARQRPGSLDKSIDEQFIELDRRLRASREMRQAQAGDRNQASAVSMAAGQVSQDSAARTTSASGR